MADAEIMIAPEVDRSSLRRMEQQLDRTFKKVGKDAGDEIEKGVTRGMKDGAKRGGRFIQLSNNIAGAVGGGLKRGFDELGGARRLGTGIGALLVGGVLDAVSKAEATQGLVTGTLSQSNADAQLAVARAAGFSNEQFGQFTSLLQQQGGFTDQQAINDILQDINVRVEEARLEEGTQRLEQFTGFRGQERINRVLASLTQVQPEEAQQILDEMGISGEDGQRLLRVIQQAGEGRTGEEAYEYLSNANKTEGEIFAENLEREAQLAKEYREAELEFNNEMRRRLLDELDSADIATVFSARQVEADKQIGLLENFQENQKIANTAAEGMHQALNALNTTTTKIFEGLGALATWAQNEFGDGEAKNARDQTNPMRNMRGGTRSSGSRSNAGGG